MTFVFLLLLFVAAALLLPVVLRLCQQHMPVRGMLGAALAFGLVLALPHLALAATVGTTVDLSPLVQAVVSVAALTITGAVPTLLVWLNRHLKLSADSLAAQRVASAVQAVAQMAISELSSVGAHNVTLDVKNAAIASAITKLSPGAQTAIATLGYTPETIAARVDGEIAKTLGTGATPVPAAPAATAPATA